MKTQTNRAFTLIELMIVVVIIAIISGIMLPSLFSSRAKARDAKRISDLNQLQFALNLFYDKCKVFPPVDVNNYPDLAYNCPNGGLLSSYISKIPTPPTDPSRPTSGINAQHTYYDYAYDLNQSDYILHTTLENSNEVQKDSFPQSLWGASSNSVRTDSGQTFTCYDATNYPKEYCLSPK